MPNATNAVTALSGAAEHSASVVWPIAIGMIGALVALSVFLRIGRKGGIKT